MNRLAIVLISLLACGVVTSCNTTATGYGYYVGALNDTSIHTLFELSDQATNERDIETFEAFFGPNCVIVDRSEGMSDMLSGGEYLKQVDLLFEEASELQIRTAINEIEYTIPGRQAVVKITEEEFSKLGGQERHYASAIEVVVGYEDGWIFFERLTCVAKQKLSD